ncbi:hypothetical protein C8Q77DRAFT_298571 [Trametes polyzona]|nr:hypothetical protein C8Q77DRAFT_298571 [Trametes polyzona]
MFFNSEYTISILLLLNLYALLHAGFIYMMGQPKRSLRALSEQVERAESKLLFLVEEGRISEKSVGETRSRIRGFRAEIDSLDFAYTPSSPFHQLLLVVRDPHGARRRALAEDVGRLRASMEAAGNR